MASCVSNIITKNYQNLITGFQVTIENVADVFGTQCSCTMLLRDITYCSNLVAVYSVFSDRILTSNHQRLQFHTHLFSTQFNKILFYIVCVLKTKSADT